MPRSLNEIKERLSTPDGDPKTLERTILDEDSELYHLDTNAAEADEQIKSLIAKIEALTEEEREVLLSEIPFVVQTFLYGMRATFFVLLAKCSTYSVEIFRYVDTSNQLLLLFFFICFASGLFISLHRNIYEQKSMDTYQELLERKPTAEDMKRLDLARKLLTSREKIGKRLEEASTYPTGQAFENIEDKKSYSETT